MSVYSKLGRFFYRDSSFFTVAGHWNSSKWVSWMVLIRQKPSMFSVYSLSYRVEQPNKKAYTLSVCECEWVFMCDETNRRNKKKGRKYLRVVFFLCIFVYKFSLILVFDIHFLSASMIIISCADALAFLFGCVSRDRGCGCGIYKWNTKGFFEINEWHWLFNFSKETVRLFVVDVF